MKTNEILWMWLIVILLCFVTTTRPTEWFSFARKYFRWTIESLKYDVSSTIIDGSGKGKEHISLANGEKDSEAGSDGKSKIFPRSRRSI